MVLVKAQPGNSIVLPITEVPFQKTYPGTLLSASHLRLYVFPRKESPVCRLLKRLELAVCTELPNVGTARVEVGG